MYAPGLVTLPYFPSKPRLNLHPIDVRNRPTSTPIVMMTTSLIKTNEDVTPDAGREVDLGLEVELDTDGQRGGLEVAVVVDGPLEEVTCVE